MGDNKYTDLNKDFDISDDIDIVDENPNIDGGNGNKITDVTTIVEEIDVELGSAFDNKAFGIPANECFTLIFQIVFAGKDGVIFRR